MAETSTSPGPASDPMRAATTTARPARSSPRTSHSPVCIPARTSMPSACAAWVIDVAHAMARPGPSKQREPVTRGVDLPPAESAQLVADRTVMRPEHRAPLAVPEGGQVLGRGDDVREEDAREDAVDLDDRSLTGQELCNLVDNGRPEALSRRCKFVSLTHESDAGYFNEPRVWDVTGEVSAVLDGDKQVLGRVENQRRSLDEMQNRTDVDVLQEVAPLCGRVARRRGSPGSLCKPTGEFRVVDEGRVDHRNELLGSPERPHRLHDRINRGLRHPDRIVIRLEVTR